MSDDHAPSSLDEAVISCLRRAGAGATRKEVRRHIKASGAAAPKREIKRALKRLAQRGRVAKEGKAYRLAAAGSESSNDSSSDGEGDSIDTPAAVPIAQRLRQKQQSIAADDSSKEGGSRAVDLDDEIARLEAELAADDDSDSGDDDISEEEDGDDIANHKKTETSVKEYDAGNAGSKRIRSNLSTDEGDGSSEDIICLSNLADDRIAPLPPSALPQNKRRTLKIDAIDDATSDSDKRKKRRREPEQHAVSEGLRDAVKDLLQNYTTRSQVAGVPFHCRICQIQSKSQAEFDAHRQSDLHKAAAAEERRRTYCKLCRKQLTSVVQMEEHLKSRPHRERMDFVKEKQRGGTWSGGGGSGRGREGKRNGGGGKRRDGSGRQWC